MLLLADIARAVDAASGMAVRQLAAFVATGRALAAGTGDNTAVTGATLARANQNDAALLIAYSATLTAAATLSFTVTREPSSDGGSTWGTPVTVLATTVEATGAGGGSTETGLIVIQDDLSGLAAGALHIRYKITPDLSAGSTDIATWGAAAVFAAQTAAGGSGVERTGETIDRLGDQSAVLGIAYRAELAASATLSLKVDRQQSLNGSSWDTAETIQALAVQATGGTGGSTNSGLLELNQDLRDVKRYVRYNVTATLSAPTTDSVSWGAVFTAGSADALPVT